jgi:hypothetical protein
MTFSLIAAVAAMIYFRMADKKARGTDPGSELRDLNLSFEPPGGPWAQDDDTRSKLGSPFILAYKRTDPEAYVAFGAKDFNTRPPRQSELREGLTQPLNRVFENIGLEGPVAGGKWLGQPALVFKLHAQWKDGPIVDGKCYATSYKGIGYWAICWAGESDVAKLEPDFDAALEKFKLLDLREKWTAKEAEVRPFGGHKLGYQVLDAEGIWSEPDPKLSPPSDVDPNADLRLVGKEKKRGRDISEEATLVALVLNDSGGDPLAEATTYAKSYWAEKIKEQSDGKLTVELTPRADEPEGDAANAVDATAPVARFDMKVAGASSQRRVVAVSAIKLDGKLVFVHTWCAWGDRSVMEARIAQIAASLREVK